MTIAKVQSVNLGNSGTTATPIVLTNPPTAGNLLVIDAGGRSDPWPINVPAGWTSLVSNLFPANDNYAHTIMAKVSDGSEQSVTFSNASSGAPETATYSEWSGFSGLPTVWGSAVSDITNDATPAIPAITGAGGRQVLIIASVWKTSAGPNPGPATLTGYTLLDDSGYALFGNQHRLTDWYRVIPDSTTSYSPGDVSSSGDGSDDSNVVHLGIDAGPAIADTDDPDAPPSEIVPPQGVLLEIYVTSGAAYRWDVANWDEGVWSSAGWTDVTPEGVRIQASWGSDRAEDGILAKTMADTWAIDFYDPERIIDPGNPDGPYVSELVPGLPVRFSHRGKVIRYGIVESLGYDYALKTGYMRVTNAISTMANANVPTDTILPNTLRARARTAIAAAGLSVTVEPDPATGDPAVADRITDEISAWAHIADAALQALHVAFMDHNDVLKFRPYDEPRDRGVVLSAPELVGLTTIIDGQTRYSTVRAFDGTDIIERSITPTPPYGAKVFSERDDRETIDAEAWDVAVLADRFTSGLRWVPGTVRPLSATSVETFGLIESAELVAITDSSADPPVSVAVKVLGGEVTVIAKANEEAVWSFLFRTAQAPAVFLVADQDETEFLRADQDHFQFLLPG